MVFRNEKGLLQGERPFFVFASAKQLAGVLLLHFYLAGDERRAAENNFRNQ